MSPWVGTANFTKDQTTLFCQRWSRSQCQCHQGHTSLEIITSRDSGLILYFGPLADGSDSILEDFLLLELRAGYPILRVNQGSGEARLTVDGRDRQGQLRVGKLSDGEWHRLDVFINGQVFYSHAHNPILT